jgi:DNA-binding NtrC family response regulator
VTETADGLGISRKNLWEKMRKLGLQAPPDQ